MEADWPPRSSKFHLHASTGSRPDRGDGSPRDNLEKTMLLPGTCSISLLVRRLPKRARKCVDHFEAINMGGRQLGFHKPRAVMLPQGQDSHHSLFVSEK